VNLCSRILNEEIQVDDVDALGNDKRFGGLRVFADDQGSSRLTAGESAECRKYTEEASRDSLQELSQHQDLYLNFRTRQMAENVSQQLIDQTQVIISDYQRAIEITKQTLDGELSQAEWQAALAPLQLLPPCNVDVTPVSGNDSSSQRLIGLLMVILVVGVTIFTVIYQRRTSTGKTR
jgi:hypothetical protein